MRVGVDDDENTDDENTEERHTSTDENTEQDIRTDENTEEQHVSYATFRALERVTPVALPNDQSLKHLFQCGFHGPSASTENEQEQEQEQEAHTLQRPVVLTCGHAVCEACAAARLDFGGAKQKGLGIIESDRHRAHSKVRRASRGNLSARGVLAASQRDALVRGRGPCVDTR